MEWRENLEALFENTADGVWVSGPDGEILFWNRAAERILEHSATEVVGRRCRDIFCGRDGRGNRLCAWPCPIKTQIKEGEKVQHFDMLTKTGTDKPVWLDISCLSFKTQNGEVPTVVHFFRDATVTRQIDTLVRQQMVKAGVTAPADLPALAGKLSSREFEVLQLMQAGAATADIAEELSISKATVRNHVQNIFSKLKVHSRLEAIAYVNRAMREDA